MSTPTSRTRKAQGLSSGMTQYGDQAFSLYLRKAFIKAAGYTDEALDKPLVGIVNTGSAFNPCHGNAPQLIEAVKRGVLMAGGLPFDFPTISLHESFSSPTSMYLRNLMAMDTEEMIRAQPMDAVVLLGGCDKTVPAQLMGAASANIPAIQLVTGAMLTGSYQAQRLGACTDCRFHWARYRAGEISEDEVNAINSQLVGSTGTCCVMGTASTMACLAEALGMMLPGGASAPAVTADRLRLAEQTGRQAVAIIAQSLTPDRILVAEAFENAMRVLLALGGSTNAIIHLTAIAGRLGLPVDLDTLDRLSRETPVLVDMKPSGRYYMEDFHRAGGLPLLLHALRDVLHLDVLTVTGRSLGEELADRSLEHEQSVIRPRSRPLSPEGGIAVLRGNLAPRGAIIKQSAACPDLMEHEGRAVVFENLEDLSLRIDDESLDVRADDILVLRQAGPAGAPGMPEAGYIPIPKKLARQGIRDMVRISDGRISGTAAGTIVVHISPESARGGPLALVRSGDRIRLSVARRRLDVLVDAAELAGRAAQAAAQVSAAPPQRGYARLYHDNVTQADEGCDFGFLRGRAQLRVPDG